MTLIFIPIMLQKPSAKSKPREHTKYLTSRLERWKNGQIKSLLDETCEIQKRIKSKTFNNNKTDSNHKLFVDLMLSGKLGDAAKKINNDDAVKGVHQLSDEIREILQEKHPKGKEAFSEAIPTTEYTPPEPVIYEEITAESVYRVAKKNERLRRPHID